MNQPFVRSFRNGRWRRWASWLLGAALLIVVALYGLRAILDHSRTPVRLVVYAFSIEEEALTLDILPAFEQAWEAETGRELIIHSVFGASGTLAGQINLGAPADVVLFSNAEHVNWLKVGRRVRPDNEPAVIGCTPMAIITRPGNPAGISEFGDLAQSGLRLIHADPRSSGAGEWAVLAEYGNALLESNNQAAAQAQLEAIWRNVRLLGPSARATLTLFELGAGDALVTYEQDARLGQDRGVALDIVVPPRTIVAQPVAVIVDDNVTPAERPVAKAFVQYLLSNAGQQAFSRFHLRPVDCQSDLFPPLSQPFTVADLGGWSQAYSDLVETLWQTWIEPRLDLEAAPKLLDTGE